MSTEPKKNYGEALYHPHIHVRDVDWLKSALLYWDGVRRIVPERFPPDEHDPDLKGEIRELVLARPELLPRTHPTNYVDEARAKFLDCARRFQGRADDKQVQTARDAILGMVQKAYQRITGAKEVDHRGLKELLDALLQDSRGGGEVDMYNGKMHDELVELFRGAGLLRDDDSTGYVWVQKAAADLYMICLATVMSERIWSPPITYKPEYADVGKYLGFAAPQRTPAPARRRSRRHAGRGLAAPQRTDDPRISLLMELELPFPSPEELHEKKLMKILDVHDKTEAERRDFREAVEELMDEASAAQGDEYRYEGFLKNKKEKLEEAFTRHREKMESLQVKGFGSFLKISAPTGISAAASAIATIGFAINPFTTGAIAVTGAVLSGLAWWGEVRQQRRDAIENFPYHYLLTLEKELPSSNP